MLVRLFCRAVLLVRGLGPLDHVPQPLQQRVHEGGHPAGERRQQVGEVGAGAGRPVAGHVGLAEADLHVGAQPGEDVGRPDQLHHRGVLAAGTEHAAVREDDPDRQRGHRPAEEDLGDGGVHRHARRRREPRPVRLVRPRHGEAGLLGGARPLHGGHDGLPFACGGRGTTGSRRNHSFTPCRRISALTRNAIIGNRRAAPSTVRRVAGRAVPRTRGGERRGAVLPERHGDPQPRARRGEPHQVAAGDLKNGET